MGRSPAAGSNAVAQGEPNMSRKFRRPMLALAVAAIGTIGAIGFVHAQMRTGNADGKPAVMAHAEGQRTTGRFQGAKANTGYALETMENGRIRLSVSDDFEIPNTPAPSWQIVDSQGNTYLLNQFKIKSGTNRSIVLPTYIKDVQKVQVWCSYAEVLLGEASFEK
jgi:hypothetical protein